ncbi:uncharacterized protein LOC129959508 isoform X1 [Argiope bruennichi]|uniref:Uncharacterized protein n=1 Tax=Argiope bruennichi TaxID=94029 RepID=A0A8T0F0N8_ARGBR|nr:uncharacterized protein LOC129959508 isoform X1 [Argiope bruennichi]KAF8784696.1 hypothetical protein HNY73_010342 [Argiope bruennichi]
MQIEEVIQMISMTILGILLGSLICYVLYMKCMRPFCAKQIRRSSFRRTSSLELPPCRTFTDSMLNIDIHEYLNDTEEDQEPYSLDTANGDCTYESMENMEEPQEESYTLDETELVTTEQLVRDLV